MIHPGQFAKGPVPVGAMDFFFRGSIRPLRCADSAPATAHPVTWRREAGKGKRQAGVNSIRQPAVNNLDQRDVSFGDGFKKPVFLEKLFVFRMPHKGKMRVQHDD